METKRMDLNELANAQDEAYIEEQFMLATYMPFFMSQYIILPTKAPESEQRHSRTYPIPS
jgi:hypothetical protein